MPKRKDFRQNAGDPFGNEESAESTNSVFQTADEIYGSSDIFNQMGQAEARHGRIAQQDIFTILPDPQQPRRAIPSIVREVWTGTPESIDQLLLAWLDAIKQERGNELPLDAYILQDDELLDGQNDRDPGPLEAHFLEVVNLAISIRQEGLTNPISIVPSGNIFRIETGERRWLAYQLLHWMFQGQAPQFPDERDLWRKIPARKMDMQSVWRQAAENNVRQNLNAIGKARQFAILMMDLWRNDERNPRTFEAFDSFENEQDYYRQVVELSPPYGQSSKLFSAMGFKDRKAIMRYRNLLNLHPDLWRMADDTNCPEGVLRRIVKLPDDEALGQFEAWLENQTVPIGNISDASKSLPINNPNRQKANRPTLLEDPACRSGKKLFTSGKKQKVSLNVRELIALHDGVGEAAPATKSQIQQMVEDLRRVLDEIESAL